MSNVWYSEWELFPHSVVHAKFSQKIKLNNCENLFDFILTKPEKYNILYSMKRTNVQRKKENLWQAKKKNKKHWRLL